MARFRNHYKCPACEITWSETMSGPYADQCPVCRDGWVKPDESDERNEDTLLTRRGVVVEEALSAAKAAHEHEQGNPT
jgi:Zn-finger nucleic acid-binding protein